MKAEVLVLPCIGAIGIMPGKLATELQKRKLFGVCVCTLYMSVQEVICVIQLQSDTGRSKAEPGAGAFNSELWF